MRVKMFYVLINPGIIGTMVKCGEPVGIAQDISQRYNRPGEPEMIPHVHLEIVNLDPECLMEV